jgi:hypothetical protein
VNLHKAIKEKSSLRFIALLVVPLYFILHNFFLYHELINFSSLSGYIFFWLILPYMVHAAISWRFQNKIITSIVLTQVILIFFFSFGPVYSFLSNISYLKPLTKVSVIFGLLLLVTSYFFFYVSKIRYEMSRFPGFIILLCLILNFFDLVNFFFFKNQLFDNKYKLSLKYPISHLSKPMEKKPDIYYIIFDELTRTDAARKILDYDNSSLDTALVQKGFFICSKSTSAYTATPFSIASAFQGSIFEKEKKKNIHLLDYVTAYNEIGANQFIPYLKNQGYQIKNFSHYKIYKEERSEYYRDPMFDTRQIVINQTFPNLMYYLLKNIIKDCFGRYLSLIVFDDVSSHMQQRITHTFNLLKQEANKKDKYPKFVHAHFFAPHLPVYFDSTGRELNQKEINYLDYEESPNLSYTINLAFARLLILRIVDDILKNSGNNAIIVIQSDHGYRGYKSASVPADSKFENFTAIYFPDKNYQLLTDELFMPNTFRLILKKYSKNTISLTPIEHKVMSSDFLDE